jgi:hypothetical protein
MLYQLPPPDLARQLASCQAVTRALGISVFVDQQYEADDLIGTLTHQATREGMPVVIVSRLPRTSNSCLLHWGLSGCYTVSLVGRYRLWTLPGACRKTLGVKKRRPLPLRGVAFSLTAQYPVEKGWL